MRLREGVSLFVVMAAGGGWMGSVVAAAPATEPSASRLHLVLPSEPTRWGLEFAYLQQSFLRADREYFEAYDGLPRMSNVQLSLHYNRDLPNARRRFDLDFIHSIGEERSYLNPSEFYTRIQSPVGDWTVGRRVFNWFRHNEAWNLGLWENRFAWDKLAISQQGLVGLFLVNEVGPVRFTVFGSPVFLPDYVATFEATGGELISRNPWYKSPPKSIEVLGGEKRVLYTLQIPDIWEGIVQNPSAGAVLEWERESQWFRVGTTYKPVNQLLLGFPFVLNTPEEGSETISVDVYPRVLYHHLASAEWGWQGRRWGVTAGASYDRPIRDETPELWITQETDSATSAAYEVTYRIEGEGSSRADLFLGGYELWGGNRPDDGPFPLNVSFFDGRYLFNRAMMAGVRNFHLFSAGYPIFADARGVYDFAQRGLIGTLELTMKIGAAFRVGLRGDALGLLDEETPDVDDGFIRNYRANDRLQGVVSYAF